MQKTKACSILMMAGALVACGKDKHQEPMTPAAGQQPDQRMQTAPTYQQPAAPAQPGMEQSGEWQPEMQGPQTPTSEQPAQPRTPTSSTTRRLATSTLPSPKRFTP